MAARSRLTAAAAVLTLACLASPAQADPGQVYLVQASGWMDGYVNNTGGDFQRSVARLIELTTAPGWSIAVASFNRHKEALERGNDCSPRTLFPADDCREQPTLAPWNAAGVADALGRLRIPTNPRGGLANAFIDEALIRARVIHLGDAPEGIVWLVTNNKNAPVGALEPSEVADNTRAFMEALKSAADISAVVAVPIEMRATSLAHPRFGTHYGFIVYGIAYGDAGRALLKAVTSRPEFIEAFGQPFRIRPLDDEPLRLTIAPQTADDTVRVTIDPDGRIRVAGVEIGRPIPLSLGARLDNTLYPHAIRRATLAISWQPETEHPVGELQATVSPSTVTDIGPLDSRDVTVTLDFAARTAPAEASRFKTQQFEENGSLRLEVRDIELSQDPAALARLRSVFLGGAVNPNAASPPDATIPDIFLPGTTTARSDGRVPLAFTATVSPFDTVVRVGAVGAGLAFLAFAWLAAFRPRRQIAVIDGQMRPFTLKPFQKTRFRGADGGEYTVRGSLLGERCGSVTPVRAKTTDRSTTRGL